MRRWVFSAAVILAICLHSQPVLSFDRPLNCVRITRNVMIPMRDGTLLAADIYAPRRVEQAPVILARTVYGKHNQGAIGGPRTALHYARHGYIFIIQDVRGRTRSQGEFYPFINDADDGQDTIAWIQNQPWFNGRLGTLGASFLGITQWLSAPDQQLDAMCMAFASPRLKEVLYRGGQLNLLTLFNWTGILGRGPYMNWRFIFNPGRFESCTEALPVIEADECAGQDIDYFKDSVDFKTARAMLETVGFQQDYERVRAPGYSVAGWYDMFLGPQLRDYQQMRSSDDELARGWKLLVGPWAHGPGGDGFVEFDDTADIEELFDLVTPLAWFDYHLRGLDTGIQNRAPVRLFIMGDNIWRDEQEWPLARTVYTPFYLRSGGQANTADGDGHLSTVIPQASEPYDSFVYDPMDPVPTLGGSNLITNCGPQDQSELETRADILFYTSDPLPEDLEVTGPITAVLYASTDAADTDFTMKLVDVHPDGRAIIIQDGIVRAMYRDNDPGRVTAPVPGEVERYAIDLWATSNVFKTGHRIRVEVSSSNFPRYNRNLNTGESTATASTGVTANQRVFHTARYPSHILLPVIPRTATETSGH